ncbi:MAG: hypothetical protein J7K21_03820 [Desulfurococcales archaeon]|nr:hypothetical protein [Desulfurococcales archaeon]
MSSKNKKWMLWGDEIYYDEGKGKVAYHIIESGDIEIYLDKNGEIVEIIVHNISKYLEPEEIREIAYKQLPYPRPKKPV